MKRKFGGSPGGCRKGSLNNYAIYKGVAAGDNIFIADS